MRCSSACTLLLLHLGVVVGAAIDGLPEHAARGFHLEIAPLTGGPLLPLETNRAGPKTKRDAEGEAKFERMLKLDDDYAKWAEDSDLRRGLGNAWSQGLRALLYRNPGNSFRSAEYHIFTR